ncbi:MAG: hypothetical protein Q4D85_09805 [Corynebacterium sp.]|uniref:hypothetical protein n=1 Tax=Corynebacterium sp. TaxID=1720 RepID=UPI0026DD3902|nr:hypothetical protein [Corynebacterium sp.]MDO5099037.1 hypothetical protein [Corynebacterium sp.]
MSTDVFIPQMFLMIDSDAGKRGNVPAYMRTVTSSTPRNGIRLYDFSKAQWRD